MLSTEGTAEEGKGKAKRKWKEEEVRDLVQKKLDKRTCWFQIKVAIALYEGNDVIACATTGAGKTLTFWIPLLMALEDGMKDPMVIIVTPLNLLSEQNIASLAKVNIPAVAVSRETASAELFKVSGRRAITINPEILMSNDNFMDLWKKRKFTSRILDFTFDESHCISQWADFRKEYKNIGALRYIVPNRIPFYVPSATLPTPVLQDIVNTLKLRQDQTKKIICSNDRPEIALVVRPLLHPADSYCDLDFLIPKGWKDGDPDPQSFLVFFDNKKEAEAAALHLKALLPQRLTISARGTAGVIHAGSPGNRSAKYQGRRPI